MALFQLKTPKIKYFIIFIIIAAVNYVFFYNNVIDWNNQGLWTNHLNRVQIDYVVVHLDLKGAPPKLEYLKSLMWLFRDNGVKGLLIEYEDMFPYEGKLVNLSAKNCYKRSELKKLIEEYVRNGIQVIPLIQTFGHMEFALKLQEFSHLREDPAYPHSICPSKEDSKALVSQMLEQVIAFHTEIAPMQYIHVGCDEVFAINECDQCKSKKVSKEVLFIDHVRHISKNIYNISPDITVLIWDDMFRNIKPLAWLTIDKFTNVEPVFWSYGKLKRFPYVNFMNYEKKFKETWIATAFKGADGKTATIPDLHNRFLNHYTWMRNTLIAKVPGKNSVYKFKGIILTGWSRYSHMDPICELLPVSIPSLLMNLRLIKKYTTGSIDTSMTMDDVFKMVLVDNDLFLTCARNVEVENVTYLNLLTYCHFYDKKLYELLVDHVAVTNGAKTMLRDDDLSAIKYYIEFNYISKIKTTLQTYIATCNDTLKKIKFNERKIAEAMKDHYENDVIDEFIGYKTSILKRDLEYWIQNIRKYSEFNGPWERRPINLSTTISITNSKH